MSCGTVGLDAGGAAEAIPLSVLTPPGCFETDLAATVAPLPAGTPAVAPGAAAAAGFATGGRGTGGFGAAVGGAAGGDAEAAAAAGVAVVVWPAMAPAAEVHVGSRSRGVGFVGDLPQSTMPTPPELRESTVLSFAAHSDASRPFSRTVRLCLRVGFRAGAVGFGSWERCQGGGMRKRKEMGGGGGIAGAGNVGVWVYMAETTTTGE